MFNLFNLLDFAVFAAIGVAFWLFDRKVIAVDFDLDCFKLRASRALNRKELLNLYFQFKDYLPRVPKHAAGHAKEVQAHIEGLLKTVGDMREDAKTVMELAKHPAAPASYTDHGAEWLQRQTLALNIDTALALTRSLTEASA